MSEITKYTLTNKETGEQVTAIPREFGDGYVTLETESGVRHNFDNPNKDGNLFNAKWDIAEQKTAKKEEKKEAK